MGHVTELSLDHDLGLTDGERELTGYDIVLWLGGEIGNGRWTRPLPEISDERASAVHRGSGREGRTDGDASSHRGMAGLSTR